MFVLTTITRCLKRPLVFIWSLIRTLVSSQRNKKPHLIGSPPEEVDVYIGSFTVKVRLKRG